MQAYPEGKPSAIAKIQVDGELMLTELGLEGDEQAEKKVHGGPDRALCHYPREHYLYWARAMLHSPLPVSSALRSRGPVWPAYR
ncbi:MOSC domain-containing protein, partial [Escherichia sp. R-CC3]